MLNLPRKSLSILPVTEPSAPTLTLQESRPQGRFAKARSQTKFGWGNFALAGVLAGGALGLSYVMAPRIETGIRREWLALGGFAVAIVLIYVVELAIHWLRVPRLAAEAEALHYKLEAKRFQLEASLLQKKLEYIADTRALLSRLGTLLVEAAKLKSDCIKQQGSAEIEQKAEAWASTVATFLTAEVGEAEAAVFMAGIADGFVGMPVGYPSDKTELLRRIHGRRTFLSEIIRAISKRQVGFPGHDPANSA